VVVGGLMFSQLVTLYLTQVFYIYMSKLQDKVAGWRKKRRQAAREEAPVAG
jgi:HAE1 family hydrophobic/amphiphilic exporter-1